MKLNVQAILCDPCTSYWLKDAIRTLLPRDSVDALRDAEILHQIMQERLDAILPWNRVRP